MISLKDRFERHIHSLQNTICTALENVEVQTKFRVDDWQREGGGGGQTRIIENGQVFEKGGVNVSTVYGDVTDVMRKGLGIKGDRFFATGISLVIHPVNPFVPTVHANIRHFELTDKDGHVVDAWFGGGMDLTPYYLFDEDAVHFHKTIKTVCDRFDPEFYPLYKKECDDYFFNTHRGEARGIGGVFFDHLRATDKHSFETIADFTMAIGSAFVSAYVPIVERRKHHDYEEKHRWWQEVRRGRYVEFNLIHDRGTLFGLKTNGRTESILMSLPPRVRWVYDYHPEKGTPESKLVFTLENPKDWV
jgi:coproporphyrinogen III oxidase